MYINYWLYFILYICLFQIYAKIKEIINILITIFIVVDVCIIAYDFIILIDIYMKKKLSLIFISLFVIIIALICIFKHEENTSSLDNELEQQENFQYKSLQGENIDEDFVGEESKEEFNVISQDIANMYFWVTTFDQYGNEVDRYTARYGSTVYDPSGNPVIVKGNLRFYINIDYSQSEGGSNSESAPIPTPEPDPQDVNYLYFKNLNGGSSSTIQFKPNGDSSKYNSLEFQYSNDKDTWIDITFNTDIPINPNETIYIKAKTTNDYVSYYDSNFKYISGIELNSKNPIEIGGSIVTLLDPTDTLRDLTGKPGCFSFLFAGMEQINTNNLKLPFTTLSEYCYEGMFNGCTSLTNAPELPATTLSESCYENMFGYCTSLTNAPKLPATTLSESCYEYMFTYCTSLTNAPKLPATTLSESCYTCMF